MMPKVKVYGKYIDLIAYIKTFICESCECDSRIELDYVPNNNSIQIRCPICNKFYGNVKYDENYGNAASTVSKTACN